MCECFSGVKVARRATGRLYEAKKGECTGLPDSQRASCKRVTCFFFFDYLFGENISGSMRNEKNCLSLQVNNVGEQVV